jgi:hypothetical protein
VYYLATMNDYQFYTKYCQETGTYIGIHNDFNKLESELKK